MGLAAVLSAQGSAYTVVTQNTSAPGSSLAHEGATWILVLTWNGKDVAPSCLDSLRPAMKRGHRVLVVDNGSTDGTPELVEREFPGVELIRNERNLGFPGGNNVGLRRALEGGAADVVLLNQDTLAAPDFADELIAAARRHPRVATVTAKIYYSDRPSTLWFAGGTCSTRTGRRRHIGLGQDDRGQFDVERTIDCPCACAMLMTRRCVEEAGLFDESLFLYGEEIDLALRTARIGLTHLFAPRAHVWHRGTTSAGATREANYLYYHARNMLYLAMGARPAAGRFARGVNYATIVATMLASIVTMRLLPIPALRAVRQGVSDFRHGRKGPRAAL